MTVGSCEFESHLLHLKLKLKRGIFVASEWENLFSRNERSRKSQVRLIKKRGIFVASEWGNLFSRNERSRKSQVYVVNAEIAQLVEHNLAPKKKKVSNLGKGK